MIVITVVVVVVIQEGAVAALVVVVVGTVVVLGNAAAFPARSPFEAPAGEHDRIDRPGVADTPPALVAPAPKSDRFRKCREIQTTASACLRVPKRLLEGCVCTWRFQGCKDFMFHCGLDRENS